MKQWHRLANVFENFRKRVNWNGYAMPVNRWAKNAASYLEQCKTKSQHFINFRKKILDRY